MEAKVLNFDPTATVCVGGEKLTLAEVATLCGCTLELVVASKHDIEVAAVRYSLCNLP